MSVFVETIKALHSDQKKNIIKINEMLRIRSVPYNDTWFAFRYLFLDLSRVFFLSFQQVHLRRFHSCHQL